MELMPIEFSEDEKTVTHPENRSFICKPANPTGDLSVLLIHGFTGTPWEMAPLARHLAAEGITSVAVRLPGHGTTPEDLAGRRYEEWVEAVQNGRQHLRNTGKRVVAVGLSTGGLITLVAHQSRRFDGIVLLSPYLRFRHSLAPYAGILQHLIPFQHRETTSVEAPHYYKKRPLAGVHQLNRLVKSVRHQLASVTVPTLVACSEGDQTVDPNSAIELFHQLGSRQKELHRYGLEAPHVLTSTENPKQQEIFNLISRFVASF